MSKRRVKLILRVCLDMQLDDVGVVQLVVALDRLAFEDPRPPDLGEFQRLFEIAMDFPGQVHDRAADRDRERLTLKVPAQPRKTCLHRPELSWGWVSRRAMTIRSVGW